MNTIIKIRLPLIVILGILLYDVCFSQKITYTNIQTFGSMSWDGVNVMENLSNNKILIGGNIRAVIKDDSLVNTSDDNGWLICIDSTSEVIWQKVFNGRKFQTITSMTRFKTGMLCSGIFQDSVSCDSSSLETSKYMDAFLFYIDSTGSVNWMKKLNFNGYVKKGTLNSNSFGTSLALLRADSIDYIDFYSIDSTGESKKDFSVSCQSLSYGDFLLNDSTITISLSFMGTLMTLDTILYGPNQQNEQSILLNFSKTGSLNWFKYINGTGIVNINSISLNDNKDFNLVGYFDQSLVIDSSIISSNGSKDIIIMQLDKYGNTKWINQLGGIGDDMGTFGISFDSNFYITGTYMKNLGIETFSNQLIELDSKSPFGNSFIIKYDQEGNAQAIYKITSTSEDYCRDLIITNNGTITALGTFYDSISLNNSYYPSNGDKDVFVALFKDPCFNFQVNLPTEQLLCWQDTIVLNVSDTNFSCMWEPGSLTDRQFVINSPGQYFLTVVNQNGCISVDSISVVELGPPEVSAGQDLLIEPGSSITLENALALNFSSILWSSNASGYFDNINLLNTSYFPSNEDIYNESIILLLDASNICGTSKDSITVSFISPSDNLIVYPNPASYILNFVSQNALILDITIFSQNGTPLFSQSGINNSIFTCNIMDYPPGSLLILVNTSNGIKNKIVNKI